MLFDDVLGQVAAQLAWISEQTGVARQRLDIEPATRALGRLGRALPVADYLLARQCWNDLARAMGEFHERYDMLLMPAMSVPLHRTPQGLPIGVQLIAAMGDDKRLLSLAGQLEQAQPWQPVSNLAR